MSFITLLQFTDHLSFLVILQLVNGYNLVVYSMFVIYSPVQYIWATFNLVHLDFAGQSSRSELFVALLC